MLPGYPDYGNIETIFIFTHYVDSYVRTTSILADSSYLTMLLLSVDIDF